ncbi:hypothetical protein ACTOV4_21515, partial [Brucella sp. C7-11G]
TSGPQKTALISGHCGAKHLSSQRDHHTFSKVGQIQHFRVVTPRMISGSMPSSHKVARWLQPTSDGHTNS